MSCCIKEFQVGKNVMLSTGFTKNSTADDLAMSDAGSMGKQFHCSVWTMTHVTAIVSVIYIHMNATANGR